MGRTFVQHFIDSWAVLLVWIGGSDVHKKDINENDVNDSSVTHKDGSSDAAYI